MLQVLADVYRCAIGSRAVGAIGSNYLDKATRVPSFKLSRFGPSNWADSEVVIASGTLLSVQVAGIVGAFREDYFVDLADLEYCLRLRRAGFDVLVTREPLMEHTAGNPTPASFLWKRLTLRGVPPIRYYYMIRNAIALAREYHSTEPHVTRRLLMWSTTESIKILLAGKKKTAYAKAICRGLVDGIAGKMGR
jgi:rhamnosyltransferase